jgi:AraC-like DNA-binding protein
MEIRDVAFQVYRALEGFPVPVHLETETQFSPVYRNTNGRFDGLFVYTLKGRGCFEEADKRIHQLLPGIAYACSGSEPGVKYYYPADAAEPWTFMWFRFKGKYAESMLKSVICRYGRTYRIPETHPVIVELLTLQNSLEPVHVMSPHEGSALVFAVINMLAETHEKKHSENHSSQLILKAQQMIISRIHEKVSCGRVAAELNISREHFSRIFKQQTGVTPNEFIARRKIIHACHLLKDTRMNCKEIAFSVGYETPANFIRAFKGYQKITPLQFRKNGAIPIY